ncbi:serine/threonine-protein kinase VRK1-like isoform X2 [Rhodnius prolixus]|uniref:serine/threonine-protein kinase VRK1-like isoform X2 n=1 Tax=Rhodnius prolixus TaxID=13249 RepID=UPI003D18B6E9
MAPRQLYYDQMAIQKKRNPSTNDRVPDLIKEGEILCDVTKRKWRLGKSIGMGAFGDIYLASDDISRHVGPDARYVIKMEPHSSGPLFVEMNFYLRVAQEDRIAEWKSIRRLANLGMPHMYSFGSHVHRGTRMRFIVLPRYGESIEKMLMKNSYKFHVKTALTLASHILNVLEYVHSKGYVHSDLKGHNMVLGAERNHAPVYLVDFGLATRYRNKNGTHKEASPDGRKAEAGTMEFSSRDAHKGVMTRRSDLESLGYNIITWLGGRLPWEDCLGSPEQVAERKEQAMSNIRYFLKESFPNRPSPSVLEEYFTYISALDFDTDPEYKYLRRLFCTAIREEGFLDDSILSFDNHAKLSKNTAYKRKAERENLIGPKKKKKTFFSVARNPCSIHNHNFSAVRQTRNLDRGSNLRSKKFNWATILAMNPDKIIKKDRCKNYLQSPSSKSMLVTKTDGLSNPTPAMLKVMERSKRRTSEQSSKRSRGDSSPPSGLTPAMEEVLASRMLYTRVLRSSSRRQKQYFK